MHEHQNAPLEIGLFQLSEIENLLDEEFTLQNELAKIESSELVEIESLLYDEKKQTTKWTCYQKVLNSCDAEKFPYAIALLESLARHLPEDPEVRQWQANTYQRWGRRLVEENQVEKARIYLKKALKLDPHNRTLWSEVEQDFRRLETILFSFVA